MDGPTEQLGISFCRSEDQSSQSQSSKITVSPGLALLLRGDTRAVRIRRNRISALTVCTGDNPPYRLLQIRDKAVVVVEWDGGSPFAQVNSLLLRLGEEANAGDPIRISIDAMTLDIHKAAVVDYHGCVIASKNLCLTVYENRGEDLSFLKARNHHSSPGKGSPAIKTPQPSGSERLQQKIINKRKQDTKTTSTYDTSAMPIATAMLRMVTPKITTPPPHASPLSPNRPSSQEKAIKAFLGTNQQRNPEGHRADLLALGRGTIPPPELQPANTPREHAINAYIEFLAITKATRDANLATCNKIMQTYQRGNTKLLEVELEEADAAVYDNDSSKVLIGKMSGQYMAAYNNTKGFVGLVEDEQRGVGPPKFNTPTSDPVVVVAKCTRVMLDDRILDMARAISSDPRPGAALDT